MLASLSEEYISKLPNDHNKAIKIIGKSDVNSIVKIGAFTNAASWKPEYKLSPHCQTLFLKNPF
jgi:hypothetical protein